MGNYPHQCVSIMPYLRLETNALDLIFMGSYQKIGSKLFDGGLAVLETIDYLI